MRKSIKCVTFTLLVFVVSLLRYGNVIAQPAKLPPPQSSAHDLIAEVNALRAANGLPAYTDNSILMQIAQDQANYMAASGQVAHRPGLTQRLLNAGYPLAGDLSQGGFRSENITGGNKTAAQAVLEWTGDALHLNTMLSPNLTEIGAGVAQAGGRYYMVIDCAQPTISGVPQVFTPNATGAVTESFGPSDFIVPVTTSTPDENGLVYHEVQSGQTLWAIAIEYGVKINDIRAMNNLGETTEIFPGDKLLVRKDAPLPTATATLEVTAMPSDIFQTGTATSFPTATLPPADTPTILIKDLTGASKGGSVAGIGVGIALVAILFAGMLTWMGSRKANK